MGRPLSNTDKAMVFVTTNTAKSKLREGSERRAIVNRIIDAGGKIQLGKLVALCGYNIRGTVQALQAAGWLTVEEPQA